MKELSKDHIVARLLIEVEYNDLPDTTDIKDYLDSLNGDGNVVKADLFILKETKVDLKP